MPPKTKAPKSPRQCVSNSEAASGLLTGLQGTDARTNLPGTPYSVRRRYLMQPRRAPGRESVKGAVLEPLSRSIKKAFAQQMLGAGRLRTARPRLWQRLSSPILSSLLKKESGPRRAVAYLPGRHWLVKICKFRFAPRVAEYCSADLFLCCSNPSDQAPHQVSHGSSGHCTLFCTQKAPSGPPM